MPASAKQVSYALHLLSVKGYSTRFMDASFGKLGARMKERSGKVEDWLKSLDMAEMSQLIDKLKS